MRRFISKLALLACSTAALVGCGVPGVPQPPSLDLPQPVADLRAVRKGDSVYLIWTAPGETTDGIALRHLGPTRICRSLDVRMSDCANPVNEIPAPESSPTTPQQSKPANPTPTQTSYTDILSQGLLTERLNAQIFYAISVMNGSRRSAGLSNIVQVPATPVPPPPPDFHAQVTAEGIVLNWTGIPPTSLVPGFEYAYRVYRSSEGAADIVVSESPLDAPSSTKFVDHSFEWEGTYSYRATVVTLIRDEGKSGLRLEGADTPAVKVFAHDVFPPGVPSDLQAAFSGVGQPPFIDLIWAPDTDADLAGYNVFRHEVDGEPIKINPTLVKTPAFRDMNVASGHEYFYSLSAVDVRGNESARSQETREAVP